jgi:hypothetical protein
MLGLLRNFTLEDLPYFYRSIVSIEPAFQTTVEFSRRFFAVRRLFGGVFCKILLS